jgi:hypothetical protein
MRNPHLSTKEPLPTTIIIRPHPTAYPLRNFPIEVEVGYSV